MTQETKPAEVTQVTEQPVVATSATQPVDTKKIAVDIAPGVSVELDIETAKKVIQHRDSKVKGYNELKEQISKSEAAAKAASDRESLLQAMRNGEIEQVKSQVAGQYIDKINLYEQKIFREGTRNLLVEAGVLPEAASDAVTLALQGAKVSLDGDAIKINDKDAKEYLAEFVKTRPHLVAVKTKDKQIVKAGTKAVERASGSEALSKGLAKFFK